MDNNEADKFYDPDGSKAKTAELEEKYKAEGDPFYSPGAVKSSGPYGSSLKAGVERLADNGLLPSEQTEEHQIAYRKFFYELNTEPQLAERIHSRIAHGLVNPPSQTEVNQWAVESRQRLREKYGQAEAEKLLVETKEYMKDAGVGRDLLTSGMGNHPDIVDALVEKIRSKRSF